MKIRTIKRRIASIVSTRITSVSVATKRAITVMKYPVLRKKDGVQVAVVDTMAEVEALIAKAKASKKAALELGTPFEVAA